MGEEASSCTVQMEIIFFEEVRSTEKSGEVVCTGNANRVTVTFEPYVQLPELAELYIAKGGRGERSRDDTLPIRL